MKKLVFIVSVCFLVISCGDSIKPAKVVSPEPSETIIKNNKGKDFSIVLDDMKIEEETNLTAYKHKYNILTVIDDSLHVKETPWQTVNESYFTSHENDLGMEIVSNHNNKLTRVARPVGFGWAIGNDKHGKWEPVQKDSTNTASNTSNNSRRRWSTSPSSFFFLYWMASRRSTSRRDFNSFQSHSNRGASYYGNSTGAANYAYGTRSNHQRTTRSSFFTRRSSNSSSWSNHNNRTSRSSSRYSSGSTTRSRSGGTGK